MLYEYYFQDRKPSVKQVLKQVNEGIKQNAKLIEVSWGENMVTLQRIGTNQQWDGSGWIKGISGYDIAEDLNKKQTNKTLNLWNS
jgi:hypothetical protein